MTSALMTPFVHKYSLVVMSQKQCFQDTTRPNDRYMKMFFKFKNVFFFIY
jgi:hypothetical protein